MLPNMTVLQALSSAGMTQFANTKKIYVMRMQNGKQVKLPVNYRKLVKGEQMDQNYRASAGRHNCCPVVAGAHVADSMDTMATQRTIRVLLVVLGLCLLAAAQNEPSRRTYWARARARADCASPQSR